MPALRRIVLLTILVLTVGAVAADAQRPPRQGQPVAPGPGDQCPNGETGFESAEECEAALAEQGWTKGPDGRWTPPPGYRDEDGSGGGSGGRAGLLSVPGSVRLGRLHTRGVTLTLRLPSSEMNVNARLVLRGRTVGRASSGRLSAGKDTLRVRASKDGRSRLERALARRNKVKLSVKVSARPSGRRAASVSDTKPLVVTR